MSRLLGLTDSSSLSEFKRLFNFSVTFTFILSIVAVVPLSLPFFLFERSLDLDSDLDTLSEEIGSTGSTRRAKARVAEEGLIRRPWPAFRVLFLLTTGGDVVS